ncbi:MAG: CoA-transferase [Chloroflexota bacterium]
MTGKFEDLLESTFRLAENEGEDKVVSLDEAVRRLVKPGMKIHIGTTHCCSSATLLEMARQFRGRSPAFTMVMRGIRDTAMVMLHLGLVKKVITSFSGNVYPWYGPNPVTQKAYDGKDFVLEDWSILTFPLMLLAGALGLGFIPTTSILGSTMAEDNRESFREMDDPFGSGRKLGIIRALNPELSVVHALAADRAGNAIIAPPYSESLWGAKASTGGVLLTTEHLVSTDFIRKYSHLVKLPGYMVKSVSVVPLGAHPNGVWNQGIGELEAYAEDYIFMAEFNRICKDPAALDAWIKEWLPEGGSFDDYRERLGNERIASLKSDADPDAWRSRLETMAGTVSESGEGSPTEMMVIAAAREIVAKVQRERYQTALAGAGTANLSAWLAKYHLQKEGYSLELMVELGYYGNSPRPGEPFVLNFGNFPTCKMLTETLDTIGVFTCGTTNRCIGVLGGGEVDKYGNINSTRMAGGTYLTGSGGANDVASGAREVVLLMKQSKERFREKLAYITAPGRQVRMLVSSIGVFEKPDAEGELTFTKYFTRPGFASAEEAARAARENCGWDLRVAPELAAVPPPLPEELRLLRIFDPQKFYLR